MKLIFRRPGLGRPLLDAGLLRRRTAEFDPFVFAEFKVDNLASCKVFESLGFSVRHEGLETVKCTCKIKSF